MQALARRTRYEHGFTLIEMMVTLAILAIVTVVLTTLIIGAGRSRTSSVNGVEATNAARTALQMMVEDIRIAGYGVDIDYTASPQPPIAYVDSLQILIYGNLNPYPDTTAKRMPPLAYNPLGLPKPRPLDGTSWQPPIKYRTGAEIIRWSLDANNDGQVDNSDRAGEGVDAMATRNPNDFVLIRQVYGDSTGNVPLNNGGSTERIALVRKPGAGIRPLFTVYLTGSPTPWNWSSGPIPAAQLKNIKRVVVEVTATSGRPDWRGQYSDTRLLGEANSLRNTPGFNFTEYLVSGYVYDDKNRNGVKDGTDTGIPDATVTVDGYLNTDTDVNGYYAISAPAGTYDVTHTPAAGYGLFGITSYTITVPPAVTRSFGDTARAGGWATVYAYNDLDGDGQRDGSDVFLGGLGIYVNGDTTAEASTATDVGVKVFVPAGGYSIATALPDSFVFTTSSPRTGTMTNGNSVTIYMGMTLKQRGSIAGKVFIDNNRDGIWQTGEPGVKGVWVGASQNGKSTTIFEYTDNNGDYTLKVPVNDPPKTHPYIVECVPTTGYAISDLTKDNIWVQANQIVSGNNFGLGGFQVISASAKRVLSLVSGDLVESDSSTGLPGTLRNDNDIVLGTESGAVDNILTWFNQYDTKPLFADNATYSRKAPYWVMAVALDSLDLTAPRRRLDMVSGTRYTAQGNLFVWMNQGTSGNEGYFPSSYSQSYLTADNGDVQAIKTYNCSGGAGIDIIVGTRSPVPGTGTIEVWQSNDATTPTYSRVQKLPDNGGGPTNMGEIVGMVLANLNSSSTPELIVGTRTGEYSGQVLVFELVSGVWKSRASYTTATNEISGITALDVDGDAKIDIVTGTKSGLTTGKIQWWKNTGSGASIALTLTQEREAPGNVTALASGDFGGTGRQDILVGYRKSNNNYLGGVLIYYTDGNDIPPSGSDPSGGKVNHMVVGITVNHFDYGTYPTTPSAPYLMDFAVGEKQNAQSGNLVVFVR